MTIRRVFPARNGQTIYNFEGTDIPSDSIRILPALAISPTDPERESGGRKIYAIQLDPEYTTPGVVIAVRPIAEHQTWRLLRPGEGFAIPGGVSGFEFYNSNGYVQSLFASEAQSHQLGAVAFLVSDSQTEMPIVVRDVQPRPTLCLLCEAGFTGGDELEAAPPADGFVDKQGWIVPGGVALLRYTFLPVNIGNQVIAPPADFAATVRLYALAPCDAVSGAAIGATADRPLLALGRWVPTDLEFSITDEIASFTVTPPPGAIAILPAIVGAVAGTGVNTIRLYVEAAG